MFALAAITLLAAGLRLVSLARVPDTPFYDAAVRSMAGSWHNFFYGAFDPTASASIDKPPFDLWLQVITVKLVGFSSTALKLPSALAASAAVPLLYDLVRRLAGRTAGVASAVTLAVLPVAVVTARSDTMDSLMMAILVADAWLLLRYAERREVRWLLLAALVLGIDFNVKLFEALVPLPAFLCFVWMSSYGSNLRQRLVPLASAGLVFVVVALSWLVAVSLTPRHDRPYPVGSTNGSVWNAVFVYNGTSRLTQAPRPSSLDKRAASRKPNTTGAANTTSTANTTSAANTTGAANTTKSATPTKSVKRAKSTRTKASGSSAPAGPFRLFRRSLVDFGGLVGTVLFAGIVLGLLALLGSSTRLVRPPPDAPRDERIRRAAVVGLGLWIFTGLVLFSFSGRVHPRYLEAFTPAVAATLGVAVSVLGRRLRDLSSFYVLAAGLGLSLLESLVAVGPGSLARAGLVAGFLVGVIGCGLVLRELHTAPPTLPGGPGSRRSSLPLWVVAFSLAALLSFPVARDIGLIRDHSGVQAASPEFPARLVKSLSGYLQAHQGTDRYEFAATAPSIAAPLIVKHPAPVLLLTTVDARPLVTLHELQAAIAAHAVAYVVMHGRCPHPPYHLLPACSSAAKWVQANGHDITAELGVHGTTAGVLFRVG